MNISLVRLLSPLRSPVSSALTRAFVSGSEKQILSTASVSLSPASDATFSKTQGIDDIPSTAFPNPIQSPAERPANAVSRIVIQPACVQLPDLRVYVMIAIVAVRHNVYDADANIESAYIWPLIHKTAIATPAANGIVNPLKSLSSVIAL